MLIKFQAILILDFSWVFSIISYWHILVLRYYEFDFLSRSLVFHWHSKPYLNSYLIYKMLIVAQNIIICKDLISFVQSLLRLILFLWIISLLLPIDCQIVIITLVKDNRQKNPHYSLLPFQMYIYFSVKYIITYI